MATCFLCIKLQQWDLALLALTRTRHTHQRSANEILVVSFCSMQQLFFYLKASRKVNIEPGLQQRNDCVISLFIPLFFFLLLLQFLVLLFLLF